MTKPALLLSDDIVKQLEAISLYQALFPELAGAEQPWEVDYNSFQDLRYKFHEIEDGVRAAYPDREITCVIAGKGAFWLPQSGLDLYRDQVGKNLKALKEDGPMPVWQLTTAEMFANHIGNLRQLVMAAAHDMVLLNQFKESLGNNHTFLNREFENSELHVRGLLDELKEQGAHLSFSLSENIMLAERCRITQELLSRGELTSKQLGYDEKTLEEAIKILDSRLKKRMPTYQRRIMAVHSQAKDLLRGGEVTQLTRVSRWDMAYAFIGKPPKGYQGQAVAAYMEREGMTAVVASREEELGASEKGKEALVIAQEAVEARKAPEAAPIPAVEGAPPQAQAPKPEKKRVRGMAFLDRKR
ncbi:MAG: hypothetical protein AB1656_17630 [Candidatus Omnitrophota bacterium]